MSIHQCPGTATLEALLLGRLDENQAVPLEEHLLTCPHCTTKAKTVAGQDTLVDAMREYRPRPVEELAAVDRIVDRLRSVTESSASVGVVEIEQPDGSGERAADDKGLFGRLARVVGKEPEEESSEKHDADLYDFLEPAESEDELGRLGPYRVLQIIGAGGMGVVFMAEDPTLKRKVAIKAMHPALAASSGARERFMREAQATAAIEHDHIVTIYQVDKDRGIPYIAMPLLRGETLDDRLDRRPKQSVAETLRMGREIAAGLAAAQEQGLIHRDIKPANIWLEETTGRVKILDFGLARSADTDSQLTQAGTIVGTPQYMSPEQAAKTDVDHRSDLFSLGCVLYRMTTGAAPFIGSDQAAILDAVASEEPPSPATLRPQMPIELSDLIQRLLSKDRDARPTSATSVLESIERIEASLRHAESVQTEVAPSTPSPVKSVASADSARRAPRFALAAVVLAMLLPLSYYAYTVIVSLTHGQLVIESDDREVEVTIKHSGRAPIVEIVDRRTKRRIYLRPGEYELDVTVKDGEDETNFTTDQFSLKRGGKEILNVRQELAKRKDAGQPEQSLVAQTSDQTSDSITEPQPLAEWLKGREVITVAQDGSGQFRTILDALKAVKPGQVVKVLDEGPYREQIDTYRLGLTLPEDVGLISEVGTRIEIPEFYSDPAAKGAKWHWGWSLDCPRGFRMAGFEIVCPKFPLDCERAAAIIHYGAGDVVIESCRILFDPRRGFSVDHKDDAPRLQLTAFFFRGMPSKHPHRVFVCDNYFQGGVEFIGQTRFAEIVVQRNAIISGARIAVQMPYYAGRVSVLHNVIRSLATGAIFFGDRHPSSGEPGQECRYLIANNVADVLDSLVSVVPSQQNLLRSPLPANVRIHNNILYSRQGNGIDFLYADDRASAKSSWDVGNNCYLAEPVPKDDGLSFGKAPSDLVNNEPFLSQDPNEGDYLRIAADSPLATTGAGGASPAYIGAFPPGPAPARGDWFTQRLYAGEESRRFTGHVGWVNSADISPDGSLVATGGIDSTVRLWDVATGKELHRFAGHKEIVWSVVFSPDGKYLASGGGGGWDETKFWTPGNDNEIRLWDVAQRKEIRRFEGHTDLVYRLAFSPDGQRLLSGGGISDHSVRLWDVETAQERQKLEGHTAWVTGVTFSPDGRQAISGGDDMTVRIWDLDSGAQLKQFDGHTQPVSCTRFHPDGKHVLSSSKDGTIRLWDIETGNETKRLTGHDGQVPWIEFTKNGRFVLSCGTDGTLRIWDVEAGEQIYRIDTHEEATWSAVFSKDSQHILSAGSNETARLWRLPDSLIK